MGWKVVGGQGRSGGWEGGCRVLTSVPEPRTPPSTCLHDLHFEDERGVRGLPPQLLVSFLLAVVLASEAPRRLRQAVLFEQRGGVAPGLG